MKRKASKRPSPLELDLLSHTFVERVGRELLQRLQAMRSKVEINEGACYVALTRMRDYGWISIKKDPKGDGRTRLFKITAEGTRVWNERAAELRAMLGGAEEGA